MFGWLLAMIGQRYGWPVPEGGAGELTAALVRRLESRGGHVRCGVPVESVVVRGGRALGVRTATGEAVRAARAVLADVPAPRLYGGLVGWPDLPGSLRADVERFDWDHATFKVDWALSARSPGRRRRPGRAGTVHLSAGLDAMSVYAGAARHGTGPVRAVRAPRPDDHRGPVPLPRRNRVGLGLHPRAAASEGRRGARRRHRSLGRAEQDAMAARLERAVERSRPVSAP